MKSGKHANASGLGRQVDRAQYFPLHRQSGGRRILLQGHHGESIFV
jgi:hypothetical protein